MILLPSPILTALQAEAVTVEQIVTTGGTAGLIAYLLWTVERFGSGKWVARERLEAAEKRTAEANARTEAALLAGERATSSVEALTGELAGYRTLVERLLSERIGGGEQ